MSKGQFKLVAIASLVLSELNPRKYISPEGIEALADNIGAMKRLVTPLTVRPQENGTFEVIAGERRTRALRLLVERGTFKDSQTFPAMVVKVDDLEALEIAIAENDNREDVHPMEEADAYLALEMRGLTVEEISNRTGKAKEVVRRLLALASGVSPTTRKLFTDGVIDLAQARVMTIVSTSAQEAYLERHAEYDYDVSQLTAISEEEAADLAGQDLPYYQDDDGVFYSVPEGVEEVIVGYHLYNAESIRRELVGEKVPVSRAQFDLAEYKRRGGSTSGNMFSEDEFFDNRELFNELQRLAMGQLQNELTQEGKFVYVEQKAPDYQTFGKNDRAVTLWLDESGEIRRRDAYGPKLIRADEVQAFLDEQKAKNGKGSGSENANKKRIRLEDRAINQAVESSMMASARLAWEVLILNFLGVYGLRLDVSSGFMNPHEGYHASVAIQPVARFYAALEAAGVKLGGHHGSKEGEPLLHFDVYGSYTSREEGAERVDNVAEARKVLAAYSDDEVALLAQAFITLSMTPVHDGAATALQEIVLEVAKPNVPEFFVRDEAYLQACKNAELETIYGDLGSNILHDKKKDRVAYISGTLAAKYAEYVPPRLAELVQDPGVTA